MDNFISQVAVSGVTEIIKIGINKLLDSKWRSETEGSKSIIEQFNDDNVFDKYISNYFNSIRYIRTIHKESVDTELNSVYYPLKMKANIKNGVRVVIVKDDFTIKGSGIKNIIGIAGQGKSTILRKLFIEEIMSGGRFPFFIELRIIKDNNVLSELSNQLTNLNIEFTEEQLAFLLQSGKVVLMLDGFDEVHTQNREILLQNIFMINDRYNCSIITTSRPDTEICRAPRIINYEVMKLTEEDSLGIIKKIAEENEFNDICKLLIENQSLLETLVTPILVTLLYACYPYWDSVPNNLTDFYNKLFNTLYYKHDRLKNYSRPRVSKVQSDEALWCFSALCFFSLKDEIYEYNHNKIISYLKQIVKGQGYDVEQAGLLIKDICNITCLIQEEGIGRYVFIHKSIQEFHAAVFISQLDSERKKQFYSYLITIIDVKDRFDNLIYYLSDIDSDDYHKLLVLKKIEAIGVVGNDFYNSKVVTDVFLNNLLNYDIYFDVYFDGIQKIVRIQEFPDISKNNIFAGIDFLINFNRSDDEIYRVVEIIVYNKGGINNLFNYEDVVKMNHTKKSISNNSKVEINKKILQEKISVSLRDFLVSYDEENIIQELISYKLIEYRDKLFIPAMKRIKNKDDVFNELWGLNV